jgi:cell division protein FtsW (lipid II flippase)
MKKNSAIDYVVSYDMTVFVCYLLLCTAGIIVMLDIVVLQSSLSAFFHHLTYVSAGFVLVVFTIYSIKLDKLRKLNIWYVAIAITLLILVLIFGTEINGAKRTLWFFQPSFLARLALVFYYAGFLELNSAKLKQTNLKLLIKDFMPLIIYTAFILGLIALEKHLSTPIIASMTLLCLLIYAGIRKRVTLLILGCGLLVGCLILIGGAGFRSGRIKTYLSYNILSKEKKLDNGGQGSYQVKETLTALSRGSLIGTGMARGRAKHQYLPEATSDYIYTIIGEEFGFLGAILILGLHTLLFLRILRIAEQQQSQYYKYLCAGLAFNIFINALVNTGVAISILPATGNTLPFISSGGTALIVDSISIGIVLNISSKRRTI